MKCQDCKYWKGKQTTIGRECLNPTKVEAWNAKEKLYTELGYRYPRVVARYKYASAPACKEFEAMLHDHKIKIEPCYMVYLINKDGEVVKSEIVAGRKANAHAVGEEMMMEIASCKTSTSVI